MSRVALFCFLFMALLPRCLDAKLVGYDFQGNFFSQPFDPTAPPPVIFGSFFPPAGTVNGRFLYDTESGGFDTTDERLYRQQIPDGFYAKFGTIEVSASEYFIKVADDLGGTDQFGVRFQTGVQTFVKPLVVDGKDFSSGQFRLDFISPDDLYGSDRSLPASIAPTDFPPGSMLLSDTHLGGINWNPRLLSFNVTFSETVIAPEPASLLIFLSGTIAVLVTCRVRTHVRTVA